MENQNQVAVITPADAKARALKVLQDNRECISLVRPDDLETAALFVPVVSVIKPVPEDFHPAIPGIGTLPRVPMMNLIAEKAGVSITRTEDRKEGEYVWVAHAFGTKRMPDGTMRETDASYEFDANVRAELDYINDAKSREPKYTTEIAKRKHLLELAKFARQKAVTGAQLALIHKLAKVPASYKTPEELMRGLVVLRIDRNVDGVLRDPGMREAVIANALGARDAVFGPRDVTPKAAQIEAPEDDEDLDFGADDSAAPPAGMEITPAAEETPEQRERKRLRSLLEEWLGSDAIQSHRPKAGTMRAADAIRKLLAQVDAADHVGHGWPPVTGKGSLQEMVDRCVKLAERRKAGAA